ncbi:hypothetical protein WMO40_19435 [Bacillaceae bacterium CLA-AA-H227]|uniref:Uncharacterized protein n=1 Tax=Robertmurraya yapensis (ex Hitch et al 2024) TaxID=3133160 RepID=A0ACC6SFP1_9BACI
MREAGYDLFIFYSERLIELIRRQRDYGLNQQESLELKEKCQKMINKIDYQLKSR